MKPMAKNCNVAEEKRILEAFGIKKDGVDFSLSGHIDVVCRNSDGSIAWEEHKDNVITDYGRRRFANQSMWSMYMFSSPSTETATLARYALADAGASSGSQASIVSPTYSAPTLTKTWTTSFGTPPANRTIGTIGLAVATKNSSLGMYSIVAFTTISPVKTQSTTQTLEVAYRVTLTPVY